MTDKYTAQEVQEVLENLEWEKQYAVYKEKEPVTEASGFQRRTYELDDKGCLVVDHYEPYTHGWSWSEAEDEKDGHTWDTSIGGVTKVASDPGGEGHGEHIWVVVKVEQTGQHFQIDGYYQSYGDGSVYDGDMYEVTPVEKTVIVYER